MKKERVKTPVDGGFGARLTFAIIFTLGVVICLSLAFFFMAEYKTSMNSGVVFAISLLFGLSAGFGFYAVIGYVGAIAGKRHKWANVLLIVFSAPVCIYLLGLLGVIGGAVGIKDINDPQRIEARNQKILKSGGFGLRLASAIIFALVAIGVAIGSIFAYSNWHSKSFMRWFDLGENHETVRNNGSVELTCDLQYDEWDVIDISDLGYGINDKPVRATIQYYVLTEVEGEEGSTNKYYETEVFYFSSEDSAAKTATFKSENGYTLTISYSNWETHTKFIENGGWVTEGDDVAVTFFVGFAVIFTVIALALFIGAFAGKKRKWGNNISIVVGAVTTPSLIGIFAIVGGVRGNYKLEVAQRAAMRLEEPAQVNAETVSVSAPQTVTETAQPCGSGLEKSQTIQEARQKLLADYPVDYENKPTVSKVLDPENSQNLILENENGDMLEFVQLYVNTYNGNLYLVTETVGLSEEEGGGIIIFRVDYDNDLFNLEQDDAICEAVFEEYKAAVNASHVYEKQQIKRSEFKLDLYDANIDEKTWKTFKKTATQEELAVIAIGAKYRIAHSRIKNIIYAIGIILSIAIFWPTGGWSLLGYPVFAFLATKSIRYEDTYGQSYRKLNKEYKAFVDGYFNSNIGFKILDLIIYMATFWLTVPYQAILLLIGTFAPNFVISKNGILVSIPKGYDVGGLGAVGAYYESISFIDEALASNKNSSAGGSGSSPADGYYKKDAYTYTDSHGYEQTVYSSDGKEFYDVGGHYVGSSGDGGTFKKND